MPSSEFLLELEQLELSSRQPVVAATKGLLAIAFDSGRPGTSLSELSSADPAYLHLKCPVEVHGTSVTVKSPRGLSLCLAES